MRKTSPFAVRKLNLPRLTVLLSILTVTTIDVNAQAGTAPVNPPVGGMKIDGFLQRQDVLIGDWLKGGPGGMLPAGSYLFNDGGTAQAPYDGPAYVGKIFNKVDPYNNQSTDDIFDGGNKLHQNPNLWKWRTQKPPAKDDINHALVFVTKDEDDNVWVLITGDRMSTNGTSYLDIEFYQKSITRTGGPTGGFVSTGTDGGRTVGDLDVTLSYTGGGSVASVSFLQWAPASEGGGFVWTSLTPPGGTAYVAANNGFTINVPFNAFGKSTYKSLQFIEAAINLTELIGTGIGGGGGTGGGPCQALPFRSIFIKTKSSAAPTADLKDFINPFAINFCTDDIAPEISATGNNSALGCNPSASDINGALGSATATDACSTPTVTFTDGAVQSSSCGRSQTRKFTATDDCGNTATTSRTANWIADNTPPVFTGTYPDVILACNPANPDGSLGTATATDACGGNTITHSDGDIVSNNCNRSRTRTFTARDGCNNTSTISRTVRWVADNTPPGFTGNYADVVLACNPANPSGSLGSATATDACGTITNISSSDGPVVSDGCNRSKKRTFTATDGCLNTATISRTVRWVEDNTPPAFTGDYTDVVLTCNPEDPSGSLGSATATDACGAITNISSSDGPVISDGCNRSKKRTFTATDGCLNTATISRTVRWIEDNTPPAFTGVYTDVVLACNPANPDGSLGSATATDACGAVTNISSNDGSIVSTGCNRSKTRTFTARDGCQNSSTTSRTVRWIEDNTPPAFTGDYTDVVLACNPANPDGSLGTATATDACGTVTNISSIDGPVVSDGCNRSKKRTFTATDGCLNTATISRTVRWVEDNTPPAFTGDYTDVVLACNPANPDGSLGSATATDACGAVTNISSNDGPIVSTGCNRSKTRTFTARDGCQNSSTTSRTVRWIEDNTPPAFTGDYTDVVLACNPANPDGSLGTATATDACGGVTISSNDGPVVSTGCSRSKTRTFTARDGCQNSSTTSRTVRWTEDITPPVFTVCPEDFTATCDQTIPDCSPADVSATDACGSVTITCTTESDIDPGGGGISCTNCDPPAPASECTPPTSYAADVVVNNNTTWATLFPGISADNITSAIRITGTGKVTVTSGDVILKSASAVLVIDGVEFVVNNGNLKLDNAGSRFIMSNGILRTYGNMEQKPLSFVCITNSTVEIGDEAAGGLFNTGGSSTSANFQNDGGYRYLRGVCLNVTHDLQLSSTGNGTAAGGGLDIFINVCAEIGDRGTTHASTGTVDGDDSGNLQNNKNMQFYCSEFVVVENIQNQSSSTMTVCETDFRNLNGSFQNSGTLSGTGLCLAIDDNINNSGTWTATVGGWYAGGSVSGNPPLGTESTLSAVLASCFNDCSCTSSCSGTITRTWKATDACGNTATCQQVITLSDNATRNYITNNFLQEQTKASKPVLATVDKLNVSAFPNPFTDKVRFVIQSPVSGQGSLEIYNLLGQRLQVVYQGYINGGVNQVVEYRPTTTASTLIYRFRINSQQVTGKLINIRD